MRKSKGGFNLSITIENILKIESLSGLKILAGQSGIQREVTSVTVVDSPDGNEWVKGGELVLTTGYFMKDDPEEIEKQIVKIYNSGVAAFAIKLNRYIGVISNNVIEMANKLSFPIIYIPPNYKYIDIINPILLTIINEQAKNLQYSEKVHNLFTQLVINGGGIQKIVNALRNILGIDVAFYDAYYDKKYIKAFSDEFSNDIKLKILDEILLTYDHYQVYVDKRNFGYIITSNKVLKNDNAFEYDKIAIEHASTVLKLEIQKAISNRQVEARYRHEFVMDLIINNIKTIEEVNIRSNFYEWDLSTCLVSIIVDIDNFKKQYLKAKDMKKHYTMENTKLMIFESAIEVMKQYFNQVVYTTLSDSIIFLIKPLCDDKIKSIKQLKKICEEVCVQISSKSTFTATIGVGNYELSVMNIHKSYENAKRAIKISRIIYKCNTVIFYEELGVYKLLALVYKSNDAKEYYLSYLQKLMDYDLKKNGDLLNTLCCIVKNNWNLRATSKDMYVHYNTIKNRFNKISDLLDIDLGNPEQRINIIISLKLMEMAE